MQGDELGAQALELGLQRHGGVAAHEQLDLVLRDAAADVARVLAQVGLAVAHDLRRWRGEIVAGGATGQDALRVGPVVGFARGGHPGGLR